MRWLSSCLPFVLCGAFADAPAAQVCDGSEPVFSDFELSAEELDNITRQLEARHPMVSSSPGIKHHQASRVDCKFEQRYERASLLFYPHSEEAGIGSAYEVNCSRSGSEVAWRCEDVELRRYMQLAEQEFELRVAVPLPADEVQAIADAMRASLPTSDDVADAKTAILLFSSHIHGSYLMTWGNEIGQASLTMHASLRPGGTPTVAADWNVARHVWSDEDSE